MIETPGDDTAPGRDVAPASVEALAAAITGRHRPSHALELALDGMLIRVACNDAALDEHLRRYFAREIDAAGSSGAGVTPTLEVVAIEMPAPDLGLDFTDWQREPGKTGRKEAFADLADGRVVLKVRTGMQFLVGERARVAFGPCLANPNQVVNFIISQHITELMNRGWVLCHAAAVFRDGGHGDRRGLAISAVSGGGKSTLALHLLSRGLGFTSNDRLLVRADGTRGRMAGVPKKPRINPGTALSNPDLENILPAGRRAELLALDRDTLWELEEKYDVDVEETFGTGRLALAAPLDAYLILDWDRHATAPTSIERIELAERPELLPILMKSPGPFFRDPGGRSTSGVIDVDPAPYLAALAPVEVWEARGRVDFDRAVDVVLARILSGPSRS